MHIIGNVLAVLLVALVVFAGWVTWRRPFLGLGVLAGGMAFHNFVIMVLIRLGTTPPLIRVVQGWKEAIIGLLIIMFCVGLPIAAIVRWFERQA